jgi:ATP adenylyltransferase
MGGEQSGESAKVPEHDEWPELGAIDGVADPGLRDMWERLWTPHRLAYLRGENRPNAANDVECPFCRVPRGDDTSGLVVARGELVYAVLNLYPYSSGHLLICPYRHVADYTDLTPAETAEFSAFTGVGMRALRRLSNPGGFNIGMNQGAVAGAGIAAHLHQHIVPRWSGDANFLPIIARTRTMSSLLETTRDLLAEAWRREAEEL